MTSDLPEVNEGDNFAVGSPTHTLMAKKERCPCCNAHKRFLAGPRGGFAQNFACGECGTRFNNLSVFGIEVLRLGAAITSARREVESLEAPD
jgi:hypothetical protein